MIQILSTNELSGTVAYTSTGFCYYDGASYIQQSSSTATQAGSSRSQTVSAPVAFFQIDSVGTYIYQGTVTAFDYGQVTLTVAYNTASVNARKFSIVFFG